MMKRPENRTQDISDCDVPSLSLKIGNGFSRGETTIISEDRGLRYRYADLILKENRRNAVIHPAGPMIVGY